MSKFEYLKLADTVAAEIANGALKPGDRLPPQRSFAYERKIAVSTASRVYTELLRRGLVVGEVGRGTFVSGETRRGIAMPTVPSGGRCGVEALTYPFIKDIAARLGVTLVPLAMDEHGVRPDAVAKAHREAHLSALYVQPTIQNPLGMTMPPARRADLLRVVEKLGLPVIEDTVYGFLD